MFEDDPVSYATVIQFSTVAKCCLGQEEFSQPVAWLELCKMVDFQPSWHLSDHNVVDVFTLSYTAKFAVTS